MTARRTLVHLAAKTLMVLGAIFVVTVLLAAMPGHHAPSVYHQGGQSPAAQEAATLQTPAAQSKDMPDMDMDDAKSSEKAAVADMTPGHSDAHSQHMFMTTMRQETPEDVQRAEEVVAQLRSGIEKYKDYHVALAEGFKIFLPNVPQQHYHFTNWRYAVEAQFAFNPAHPTSLLYKKTLGGYELEGAMFTAPKKFTEDQLNDRVPLSVARWHKHVNFCMPPKGTPPSQVNHKEFGLGGSISTEQACSVAGGRWFPEIFNWMVHVYPYESDPQKIWAH